MGIIDTMIDITEPRYILIGYCNRCGECCIGEDCEYLEMDNGMATCLIYKGRYEKCRIFPANPPIVYRKCSYRFYDKWEGKIIGPGEV